MSPSAGLNLAIQGLRRNRRVAVVLRFRPGVAGPAIGQSPRETPGGFPTGSPALHAAMTPRRRSARGSPRQHPGKAPTVADSRRVSATSKFSDGQQRRRARARMALPWSLRRDVEPPPTSPPPQGLWRPRGAASPTDLRRRHRRPQRHRQSSLGSSTPSGGALGGPHLVAACSAASDMRDRALGWKAGIGAATVIRRQIHVGRASPRHRRRQLSHRRGGWRRSRRSRGEGGPHRDGLAHDGSSIRPREDRDAGSRRCRARAGVSCR